MSYKCTQNVYNMDNNLLFSLSYCPGNAFFTFSLHVFADAGFTSLLPNPIALDEPLYLKAEVVTQSAAPNLDLFLVSCWASSNESELAVDNKVTLITQG